MFTVPVTLTQPTYMGQPYDECEIDLSALGVRFTDISYVSSDDKECPWGGASQEASSLAKSLSPFPGVLSAQVSSQQIVVRMRTAEQDWGCLNEILERVFHFLRNLTSEEFHFTGAGENWTPKVAA